MTKSLAWIVCAISLLTAAALATIGCGGETGKPKTGSILVSMVDSSDPKISALEVKVDSIDVYHSQTGWLSLITIPVHYDFVQMGLWERVLIANYAPSGNYERLRIVISQVWATDADGRHDVEIVGNSGVMELRLSPGTVLTDDGAVNMIVDFNVEKSILKDGQGNYSLQPEASYLGDAYADSTTLQGFVSDGTVRLSKASVVVTAHPPVTGTYTAKTVAGDVEGDGIDDTGKFVAWTLKAGVYDITITWTDPNDPSRKLSATVPDVVTDHHPYIDLGTVVLTPQSN